MNKGSLEVRERKETNSKMIKNGVVVYKKCAIRNINSMNK